MSNEKNMLVALGIWNSEVHFSETSPKPFNKSFSSTKNAGILNLIFSYLGVGKTSLHKPYIRTAYIAFRIPQF